MAELEFFFPELKHNLKFDCLHPKFIIVTSIDLESTIPSKLTMNNYC